MHILSYVGLLLGLIILILLLLWQGISDIFQLLLTSGWTLLYLPVVWSPCLIPAAVSWRMLFLKPDIPSFSNVFVALWIGRAINTLLPVATIGGEIAKARLITLWGTNGVDTSAVVLVDKTVQALALLPWGIIGALLLVYLAIDNQLAIAIMMGVLALGIGIIGFILVQRAGMVGFLADFVGKFISSDNWSGVTINAREVDQKVKQIYQIRGRLGKSIIWRTTGLIMQTSEVWLACYLLGHPISLIEALMLKSLTSTISDIAFFIPNAYGIQEGGYIMLGLLLGLTPDFSLALSIATRIRELIIDLPGLLVWQHIEGKMLLKKTKKN
jgi:putative membrane protein